MRDNTLGLPLGAVAACLEADSSDRDALLGSFHGLGVPEELVVATAIGGCRHAGTDHPDGAAYLAPRKQAER